MGGDVRRGYVQGSCCRRDHVFGGGGKWGGDACRGYVQGSCAEGIMCLKCACPCHDIMLIGVHVANHVDLHLMA